MNRDKILEVIYKKLDPWSMETPEKTKDQIFAEMLKEIDARIAFPIEKDGMVFYVMPETKQRARLHVFSDTKEPGTTIRSAKWLTNFLFCNINSLEKLYGITPHKTFLPIINRFGWFYEGTITHSHFTKSGQMKDQYVFGVTRPQHEKQSNNAHKIN
jgi:transposase